MHSWISDLILIYMGDIRLFFSFTFMGFCEVSETYLISFHVHGVSGSTPFPASILLLGFQCSMHFLPPLILHCSHKPLRHPRPSLVPLYLLRYEPAMTAYPVLYHLLFPTAMVSTTLHGQLATLSLSVSPRTSFPYFNSPIFVFVTNHTHPATLFIYPFARVFMKPLLQGGTR